MDNKSVLRNGFAKAEKMIEQHLYRQLRLRCDDIFVSIERNKGFTGFTGNTQTSYTAGVYIGGKLVNIRYQDKWLRPPLRKKIPKGQRVHLEEPYEGDARTVRGEVSTKGFGRDTAVEFLRSYTPRTRGISIVVTTGTEYSEYLEDNGLNVLTATYEDVRRQLLARIEPIG